MARPLRIEYAGAIYHVTARGNERGVIVSDDADRAKWVSLLARVTERRGWRVFAFVLMANHYHLFLRTPEPDLSAGMRDLNGTYAGYFNARHSRAGHVFEGRYKGILVDNEGHWGEVSRYVHLNPVRAGLVGRPEDCVWSSYPGYYRPKARLAWVNYKRVLADFGGDNRGGRHAYRSFVAEGLGRELDTPFRTIVHGLILGSDAFVSRVAESVKGRPEDREIPMLSRLRKDRNMEDVIDAAAQAFGSNRTKWQPGRRCNDLGRAVAAYAARELCGSKLGEIAPTLGYRHAGSVSTALRRVEGALKRRAMGKEIRSLMDVLMDVLSRQPKTLNET